MRHVTAIALLLAIAACNGPEESAELPTSALDFAAAKTCPTPPDAPVRIEGGTFTMGSSAVYAEEGPERQTTVGGFWIDPHEVTNRQFAEFVEATGYVTVADGTVKANAPD